MKLWVDDVRPAPWTQNTDFWAVRSVNEAKKAVLRIESLGLTIGVIDIDHDAGDYASDGGDYIKLLDWLEETGRRYPIRIHSMNPVGVQNMRQIIHRNGWTEVR